MHFDEKNTVVSSANDMNLECVKQFAMSLILRKRGKVMDPIPVPVEHHMRYLGSVIVHYIEHIVFDLLDNFDTNLMLIREHHTIQVCVATFYGK